VRQNLFDFLEHFRARLAAYSRSPEHEPDIQHVWIDQLCIDQEAVDEKVEMMSEIYRRASYVYVWLGKSNGEMQTAMIIIKLNYRQRH
jgi:hypothetical protein